MMTFEEAHDQLNKSIFIGVENVSEEMKDWHPAVLALMLRAVHKAREKSYGSPHPYWKAVQEIYQNEPNPFE